ncbi:MAG: M23 family metallopeptidase [Chloroflexota bacterium]
MPAKIDNSPGRTKRYAKILLIILVGLTLLAGGGSTSARSNTAGASEQSSQIALIERAITAATAITSTATAALNSAQLERSTLAQPYTGDPIVSRPAPGTPAPYTRFYTETGHYLGGEFLDFYNATPNGAYRYGLPLTEEFPQQYWNGAIFRVQYFERARFEWHPELPEGRRVQLGSLSNTILKDRTFDRMPPVASTATRAYFSETGHILANGFLKYWLANGGLAAFGYPVTEEIGEDGTTVQYFERARFEFYRGLEGTPYGVQLSPVGYMALRASGFSLPMGTLVDFNPPTVAEGHTAVVTVAASAGMTVTGQYEGRTLFFHHEPERGIAWAMLGSVPFADVGTRTVTINLQNGDGGKRAVARLLQVVSYPFPAESLQFDPQTAALLDPALTTPELELLDKIFSQRTPQQYWNGPFRMPLDGSIRITSAFATRRCYNCPDGSRPTSYHGGMDMSAAVGTPVHAPADGVIVFAGKLDVRGNAIIVDHGMGVFSLFAHNSQLIATVGQRVKQGDVISLSGNTGLSNGPHLHWELHVSGPAVEPLEWVNRPLP